jgi:hypothetical protein
VYAHDELPSGSGLEGKDYECNAHFLNGGNDDTSDVPDVALVAANGTQPEHCKRIVSKLLVK